MQTLNPTNPVQTPPAANSQQLPTLPVTPNSQVLIHPEHEKGNLVIPQHIEKSKSNFPFAMTFLALGAVFLIGVIGAIVFIFLPMSQAYNFASNSKELVTASSANISKVNSSLDLLYQARSSTGNSGITVSSSGVLGANTNLTPAEVFFGAVYSSELMKDIVDKSSHVKAFSTPANDPTTVARKHRELAMGIGSQVTTAKQTLDKLIELKNQTVPSQAADLKNNLSNLETDTNDYIDQAQKTSDYYVAVSDASIELYTIASATNTTKDIDSDISQISALKAKFASYSNLPNEMDAYNKDLTDMFDLLSNYFQTLKTIVQGQNVDLNKTYANFTLQLQSISARSVSDEVSFWQNNKNIAGFTDLTKENSNVVSASQKVKDANYFFFLSWVGVN